MKFEPEFTRGRLIVTIKKGKDGVVHWSTMIIRNDTRESVSLGKANASGHGKGPKDIPVNRYTRDVDRTEASLDWVGYVRKNKSIMANLPVGKILWEYSEKVDTWSTEGVHVIVDCDVRINPPLLDQALERIKQLESQLQELGGKVKLTREEYEDFCTSWDMRAWVPWKEFFGNRGVGLAFMHYAKEQCGKDILDSVLCWEQDEDVLDKRILGFVENNQ